MVVWRVAVLSLLVLGATVWSAGPPVNPPPSVIGRWIRELGNEDFNRREEAERRLAGLDVVPAALVQASQAEDAEVRRRALRALDRVRLNAEEKDLARLLARINEVGLDLTLEAMV